ncbi:reducing end xylose-releasing exo-oligoxylanase [Ruminiclostridium hungatei]|uniref:Reducing end xylose-releasing exo-oligoxylanase n=1 Tax=Ruminiclostridium hungatei TaxID=48256 RepID=A0A1V4SKQ4_RUMHU|nr:glycosyl hydrolase family 8 [Ruminiclostridium hungatei]OPX44076.1 reducing end xylose-releasing exo-oligoxylanase [Ruminiclostridium hungatei]
MPNAFKTGSYSNLFTFYGYTESDVQQRISSSFEALFFGSDDQRIYHETGEDMGYLVDTGNLDVRSEGQSYGMMIAVQMDRKDIFDRIWKWTRRYMYLDKGDYKGYFGWSAATNGKRNAESPAPDGEEFFAMALLFAGRRWGDGEGIFDYTLEARNILHHMVHKKKDPMFDPETKLIRFVPRCNFSDPSYHLPHFYQLFALWGNPADSEFFREAAKLSREYLKKACHPKTGLSAEYAEYDGTPHNRANHHLFYSDAYRTAANIALDYEWFAEDAWACGQADNIQEFFGRTARGNENLVYHIDGTPVTNAKELVHEVDGTPPGVLHPVGLLATLAQASLASRGDFREYFVRKFWEQPLRTGNRRYYDNLLYLFALLALSGNYRIW